MCAKNDFRVDILKGLKLETILLKYRIYDKGIKKITQRDYFTKWIKSIIVINYQSKINGEQFNLKQIGLEIDCYEKLKTKIIKSKFKKFLIKYFECQLMKNAKNTQYNNKFIINRKKNNDNLFNNS